MSPYTLEDYLTNIKIPLRLACVTPSAWPVLLSLWYLYEDGYLYCATPESAKVVAYLREEPRCAFEVASDQPPYCGVRGKAMASIEPARGLEILERLLNRYLGGTDNNLARTLLGRSQPEVAIRLKPETFYTWNFSKRMADLTEGNGLKLCPD